MKLHKFQNSTCSNDDESDFCLKSYNVQNLNGSQAKQSNHFNLDIHKRVNVPNTIDTFFAIIQT